MDPILGSAIVSSGANLLGNIFGSKSNASANKTNLKIAQMNNEWNYKMFQEQMAYNEKMWNKDNEYNTAAQQAQRLREAGLNPSMVMSGQNAGTAGSAGGVTPPSASQVSVNPYQPDFSGIGNAMQNLILNRQASQQLQNDRERIRIESYNALGNFMNNVASARNKDVQTEGEKIINQFRRENQQLTNYNLRADIGLKNAQRELATKQAISVDTQNLIANKQLKHLDDLQKAQLDEIGSRIALNRAQSSKAYEDTKLTKENIKKVAEEIKETSERTYGIKITNREALNLAPYVLQRAQFDAVPTPEQEAYYYTDEQGNPLRDYKAHKVGNMYKRYGSGYELPIGIKLGIGK